MDDCRRGKTEERETLLSPSQMVRPALDRCSIVRGEEGQQAPVYRPTGATSRARKKAFLVAYSAEVPNLPYLDKACYCTLL